MQQHKSEIFKFGYLIFKKRVKCGMGTMNCNGPLLLFAVCCIAVRIA